MLENMVHISLIDKEKAKALKVGSLFGKEPHNSTSGVNAQQPDIRENFAMHLILDIYSVSTILTFILMIFIYDGWCLFTIKGSVGNNKNSNNISNIKM